MRRLCLQANGRLQEREAEVQQAKEAIMRLNVQHAAAAAAWEEDKRSVEQAHTEQVRRHVTRMAMELWKPLF